MFNKRVFEDFHQYIHENSDHVHEGAFLIQFSGQPAVKCPKFDYLFFFESKSDQGGALHGCRVFIKPKPYNGSGRHFAQVLEAYSYPSRLRLFGFLRISRNQLLFKPLDKRYGEFIVLQIDDEVWQLIKEDTEIGGYSMIGRSQASPEFIQRHFFKAEFIH